MSSYVFLIILMYTNNRVTDFHEHAVETYAWNNLLRPCHNWISCGSYNSISQLAYEPMYRDYVIK